MNICKKINRYHKSGTLRNNPLHNLIQCWFICTLIILSLLTGKVYAASPGDNFNDLLNSICGVPPAELINLCLEFGTDSGSAGSGGVGGDNNLGVVGAQNQYAKIPVSQVQESIKDRLEDEKDSAIDLGLFLTLKNGNIKRKQTYLENGYEAEETGFLIGVDHQLSDSLIAGVALNYDKINADFGAGAGTLDTKSTAATLFANYTISSNKTINVFVDAYIGTGKLDYKNVRNIFNTTVPKQVSSNTNGNQRLAGISVNFSWPKDSWIYGANIKIDYLKTEIDAFTEYSSQGNTDYRLSYPNQKQISFTTSFGFDLTYNASYSWGVLIPNFQILYVREAGNESRDITTQLAVAPSYSFITTTDEPDRDYWLTNIGASAVLQNDLQLFAEYQTIFSHVLLDKWVISLGLRKQF